MTIPAATTDPSRLETDVSVPCARWREALPEAAEVCRRAARAAFDAARGDCAGGYRGDPAAPVEASLVLADDTLVRNLNRDFRGQDRATNVLAFASLDGGNAGPGAEAPVLLGDVVVAYGTAAAEAASAGKGLADHLSHLVVHGMLHLLGYDHQSPNDAEAMETMEVRVLRSLGVASPYPDRK